MLIANGNFVARSYCSGHSRRSADPHQPHGRARGLHHPGAAQPRPEHTPALHPRRGGRRCAAADRPLLRPSTSTTRPACWATGPGRRPPPSRSARPSPRRSATTATWTITPSTASWASNVTVDLSPRPADYGVNFYNPAGQLVKGISPASLARQRPAAMAAASRSTPPAAGRSSSTTPRPWRRPPPVCAAAEFADVHRPRPLRAERQ